MALGGVGGDVHRGPLLVGAAHAVVQELHLEEALGVVLVLGAFTEVVAVVAHELITAISAGNDVLEHGKGFVILVAEHQGTGIVTGSGAAGSTAIGPLSAGILGGKQGDGVFEVGLDLVEDFVLAHVAGVHALDGGVLLIVGEQRDGLIIGGQVVVGQGTQEQGLSLDAVDPGIGAFQAGDAGENQVATVHHMEVVSPGPLVADVDLAVGIEVVIGQVPLLGGVPHLVAADGVQGVTHTGEGTLQADTVVAGDEGLVQVGLGVTEVSGGLVVRVFDIQCFFAGSHGTDDRESCQNNCYLFHDLVRIKLGHLRRKASHPASQW